MRTRGNRRRSTGPLRASPAPVRRGLAPSVARALQAGRAEVLDAGGLLDLQRAAGNATAGAFVRASSGGGRSAVLDVVDSGRGHPLDASTRRFMEARFGHDFSSVRVHADRAASDAARSLKAHAYTLGDNIVFRGDVYRPDTYAGRRMLAHELAHVVQQRSGPVPGTPAPGGINVSERSGSLERDAERRASRVCP